MGYKFKDPLQALLFGGEDIFLNLYKEFDNEVKKAIQTYIFAYASAQYEEKNTLNPEDILPLEFLQKLKDRGFLLTAEDIQAQKKVCDMLANLYDDEDKAEPHYKVYETVAEYLSEYLVKTTEKKDNDVIEPEIYEVSDKVKIERRNAVMENALIEARYNLTVEEQRLVLTTIAMLDNVEIASSGFPMLKIPVKLIIEATGIHEKNYSQIKKALQRLMGRVITIEDENGFEMYQWFAKAKYKQGEGFIEVQFHPDLKPYLLELKERFTKIPLKQILQLRSKYAIRLYELLKRYKDTGFRTDYIPELREKLGVEKGEYERFFDFERRVLKPAIKEINEKTDLKVSYTKKKTGRRITHIEFEIKSKEGDTTQTTKNPSENLDTQGPKKQPNRDQPDLWDTVLKILETTYNADPDDIDTLKQHTYAKYKTDTEPKIMAICTDVATDKGRKILLQLLNKYLERIKGIVKIETNSNYEVKVCKQFIEKGEDMPV